VTVILAGARRGAGGLLAILIEGGFGFVKDGASVGFTGSRLRCWGSFGLFWHRKDSFVLGRG
jgi:hypothetical protein